MYLYGKLVNIQTGDQIKYFDNIEEIKRWFWIDNNYKIKDRSHMAYLFEFCPTVNSPFNFPIINCEELLKKGKI